MEKSLPLLMVFILILDLSGRVYAGAGVDEVQQCGKSSYDPETGQAVLSCINAGNGAAMFDVKMRHIGGLQFGVESIAPYLYSQAQNEGDSISLKTHLIPATIPFSTDVDPSEYWLFLLVEVKSINSCGEIKGSFESMSPFSGLPPDFIGRGRIDVRVFLSECNAPGFGPRLTGLPHVFLVTADLPYDIYVGGKLRKTIQAPPASTQ